MRGYTSFLVAVTKYVSKGEEGKKALRARACLSLLGGLAGLRELVTLPSAVREQREMNAGTQLAFLAFRPAPDHGLLPLTFLVGLHLQLNLSRKIPMSTCSCVSMVILNPVSR